MAHNTAAQQYTHYDQPPHTSGSSSSDEYFSYSSEASINAGPSSSNYRDSFSQPFEQTQASSSSSIPFQPTSAAPLTVQEQLFGYVDASEQMQDEQPASTAISSSSTDQRDPEIRSATVAAAAAGNGNASDSSLSSQVSSNPLLRQDLHKNGMHSFPCFSKSR